MTFVQNLAVGNYSAVREALPKRIQDVIGQPPICDVERVVGRGKIVIFIKAELIQLSSRISVSGNITPEQMEFIATQLVEMFPNESLADFKLCFERGCMGQYGEIFRMDGIVLRGWLEKYLDEKYQLVEQTVKAEQKKHDQDPDYTGPGYEAFKKWAQQLQESVKKVPDMEQKDIAKFGKEKPHRESVTSGYKYFNVRGVEIYAITQEHAEELANKLIENGDLEEY